MLGQGTFPTGLVWFAEVFEVSNRNVRNVPHEVKSKNAAGNDGITLDVLHCTKKACVIKL